MPTILPTTATLDGLRQVEGKAELIAGRIVRRMPTGFRPGQIGGRIYRQLDDHAVRVGLGVALPDNVGFVVPELRSGRRTFSPDASLFLGHLPSDEMDFLEGPPTLAVEVRNKGDYGDSAEAEMARKRADYFEAGTLVVWDVDPRTKQIVAYQSANPDHPTVFSRGAIADAEPALPGFRLEIEPIFA